MDLPRDPRPPPRVVPDRRARPTPTRPGSSTPSATRTSRTSWTPVIDVFSTVNVQHLESLNDQVAELTGPSRCARTVPDEELAKADEIVLVDPPARGPDRPPAGRKGLSGRQDRAPRAQRLSSRVENLRSLREVALRQLAEKTSRAAGRTSRRSPSGCWRSSRSTSATSGWCGGRGGPRSASTATLDVLVVTGSEPSAEQRSRLEALRRPDRDASAPTCLVEGGDAPGGPDPRRARERGITYLLLGPPRVSRFQRKPPAAEDPAPSCQRSTVRVVAQR